MRGWPPSSWTNAHRTSAAGRRTDRLAVGTIVPGVVIGERAEQADGLACGQPRQANPVTSSSTSEIGPATATSKIARIAAVRPTAPLKRCSRTRGARKRRALLTA
jgi:hypothetical protein